MNVHEINEATPSPLFSTVATVVQIVTSFTTYYLTCRNEDRLCTNGSQSKQGTLGNQMTD